MARQPIDPIKRRPDDFHVLRRMGCQAEGAVRTGILMAGEIVMEK